jgi:predicted DNA-binding transcriptional regulator AlpA
MYNPFEALNARLDRIEELVTRLSLSNDLQPQTSEIGGISLAQEITRLSKARIYALVSARALPSAKRGNRLTFYRSELLAWVAAGKRGENNQHNR